MSTIILKCPNCGGGVSFSGSSMRTICTYCGSEVIKNPESAAKAKFYVVVTQRKKQTKHLADDEISFSVAYRRGAMMYDPDPLDMTVSTKNGSEILQKRCDNVLPGKVQIVHAGGYFNVSVNGKIRLFLNGTESNTNSFDIGYGDLLRVSNIVIRLQPV